MTPTIELITTGTELLIGRTRNRHGETLGRRLEDLDFQLSRVTTVPDSLEVIADAVRQAMERARVVIVTGGLGPTEDDVTPEAVALALGRKVIMDSGALAALHSRYGALGRRVTPAAERQARVVEGAVVLPNKIGVAPGERLEAVERVIFILPGPPAEFDAMLEAEVLPWLDTTFADRPRRLRKVLMVCGLGESDVVHRFAEAGVNRSGIQIAYCAAPGRLEIRLSAAESERAVFGDIVAQARALLGGHVYAETRTELEEVVGHLLRERKQTVATAESCTAGALGAAITSISGSSAWYRGGVVAYANDIKTSLLEIPEAMLAREGAVSAAVAGAMAERVRELCRADWGLSITGIAGPTGGSAEKPVGLVYIGRAGAEGVAVRRYRFAGSRERIREWSVRMALDMLRRCLQLVNEPDGFGMDVPLSRS